MRWISGKVHSLIRLRKYLHMSLQRWFMVRKKLKKAEETAKAIFTSGDAANMAVVKLEADAFTDGSIDIVSLIHAAGLAATKSEARRVVAQGGASVAGEKISDIAAKFDKEVFAGDGVVVKKGKKSFIKVQA